MLEFVSRMPSCGNTVKCGNPHCLFVEFHPSCLAISTPLPRVWYCPHCCRLPQFKRSKKGKEKSPEIMAKALSLNSICICQAVQKKQKQNKILLITNISNYISFPPQIAYKLIKAGRSKDILQIKSLSIDGLNNRENTTIQYIE